ncbi:acetylornithine aminotransferase [Neohortaea acidophila]|uniref:acetylornithine transaminase n=1 Tax=Neohortaea acidophila TaxID=245834 RepID=A0A6A6PHU8_9PEZI|nr:acetylornithine aminotransferase [Neohortaea acidophila]KAF2479133.1 acetylornithine aminotransferase [Neohortaea acidophila]
MSLRPCSRRIGAALRQQTCILHQTKRRCLASASSLPRETREAIEKETTLPTPDPASDSQTARLISSQSPYIVPTYVKPAPMFQKGEGCYLWDVENRRYLDWTAGIAVNALGHCDPGMSAILAQQGQTLVHCSNLYHTPWQGALSELLVEKTRASGGMKDVARVFLCNSGTEANEAAIKFARKYGKMVGGEEGGKVEIVSYNNAFHGRSMGALSATWNPKYQKPFSPMIPGFVQGNYNDMQSINEVVTEKTCGVIVEPIQGEGGVNAANVEWLEALRKRTREVGALLIFDEIQCGLSRTGWLWAHAEHGNRDIHPDVLTTAKALGNGYPIGATLVTDEVASKIVPGDHGTTFGGNPLACRISHYLVTRLADPELQTHVQHQGKQFEKGLREIAHRLPEGVVKEIRGRGLIIGMQLNSAVAPVIQAARERGLLIINAGTDVLRFVPPLIIEDAEVEKGMEVLEEALQSTFNKDGGQDWRKARQAVKDREEAPDT